MICGLFQDLLPDVLKNLYLSRYAWPGPMVKSEPNQGLKIIVVIPCYRETEIIESLNSLYQCQLPNCHTEVLVVVNHAEDESEDVKNANQQAAIEIANWSNTHDSSAISTKVIKAFELPGKTAGVGLARKIGMDEAVRRFDHLNEKKGIIVCFDADCQCSKNYLQEIYLHYALHPETNAALLYFEHPTQGNLPQNVYDGIINYELHLRYYKNALKFAHFPHSYHTIGSCITVSSEAYQKQGGMNKRKAGEDFYFLQKLFSLGNVHNINTAVVIPSPRPSDRVPFGTGKAINDMLSDQMKEYKTYNPQIFVELKSLIDKINLLYRNINIDKVIGSLSIGNNQFLETINFVNEVEKIKKNSSSEEVFLKSFYQWFNGFAVLKYVHFARDNFYENKNLIEATNWLLQELTSTMDQVKDKKIILSLLRNLDKSD